MRSGRMSVRLNLEQASHLKSACAVSGLDPATFIRTAALWGIGRKLRKADFSLEMGEMDDDADPISVRFAEEDLPRVVAEAERLELAYSEFVRLATYNFAVQVFGVRAK